MEIYITNNVQIVDPIPEFMRWIRSNLTIRNPDYDKKQRMGISVWNTPEYVSFYEEKHAYGTTVMIIPYGIWRKLQHYVPAGTKVYNNLADHGPVGFGEETKLPLYDYQERAVSDMVQSGSGVLIGPCGSGKTQIGIGAAVAMNRKTLWLTHTIDLLNQSYERAARYMPKEWLGKIARGKVEIGSHITFATVQTMAKADLKALQYEWDVVIVDECHRVCGSATQAQMFYRVISSLSALHKFGLTATLHRSDGMEASVLAILGPVCAKVNESEVKARTITPSVTIRTTGIPESVQYIKKDGSLSFTELVSYLAESPVRNAKIAEDIIAEANAGHSCLVISDRLLQLNAIMGALPENLQKKSAMIDGKMVSKKAREERENAIEDMRSGKKTILFATYGLAREGLDIPILDRLFLATPKKDWAVVKQSFGRISRVAEGKTSALGYDYLDENIGICIGLYNKRLSVYREEKFPVIHPGQTEQQAEPA